MNDTSENRDARPRGDEERYECVECGDDLPKMLVDGPVAGGNSGVAPVERCGSCEAQEMIANAN